MSKRTVSSAIRQYITDGMSNQEVWDLVSVEFDMPESKKHYPSWYRSEMKRKKTIEMESEMNYLIAGECA